MRTFVLEPWTSWDKLRANAGASEILIGFTLEPWPSLHFYKSKYLSITIITRVAEFLMF